jgi:L-lactate dehydrogenase (cytochrome)
MCAVVVETGGDGYGGAEDELTLRRNSEAFRRLEFRPRVLPDVGQVDLTTSLLSRYLPAPVVLAPTGFTRILTPGGELDVARGAARAGLPYTLSTMATRSVEEVAAVSDGPKWFQVYVWRDRALVKDLLAIRSVRSADRRTLPASSRNGAVARSMTRGSL